MAGRTQPDLTIKAIKTQRYVCRANDYFCNCVFSKWVKVKVWDIDKSGICRSILMLIYTVGCLGAFLLLLWVRISLFFLVNHQVYQCTGRASCTLRSTQNPRPSDQIENSLSAALPLAYLLRSTSGTEMVCPCSIWLETRCRWERRNKPVFTHLRAGTDCLHGAIFTVSFHRL